jgi:parvulin-like peptidyl-prolyl isomerase
MSNEKKDKKIKIQTVVGAFLSILLGYVVLVGVAIYFLPETQSIIIKKTIAIIPYPAVIIDSSNIITVRKLQNQLNSAKKFYESQDFSQIGMRVDFGTDDGKKRLSIKEKNILDKLIDDTVIEIEAGKRDINIDQEILDQEVDRKLKEYGTGEYLKNNLEKFYGWDIDDFKENIVKPDLYQEKLFDKIKEGELSYGEAREKIQEAKNDLEKNSDFIRTAKKYSQGESAQNGGALGWFSADQMLPEVAQVIFNLGKNEQSDIIESSIGFHIIKVEDERVQDDENMLKISQIFVPAKSFSQWLDEKKENYKIIIPMQKFIWNSQTKQVEFRDSSLVEYEKDLLENPINDPSIIF